MKPRAVRPLDQVPTLTIEEAALYLGVSTSQFRALAPVCGLVPQKIMGRIMYRRGDLDRYVEAQWQGIESAQAQAQNIGRSHGANTARRARNPSGLSPDCAKPKSEKSPAAKVVSLPLPSTAAHEYSTASPPFVVTT
ncbi:MAG: helix-turn-helix domain-containing protein [Rhodocyclaceae bacterium]|nr:helix-turn-helix domain-containing protein [Rhodocyclaceae bacterium]